MKAEVENRLVARTDLCDSGFQVIGPFKDQQRVFKVAIVHIGYHELNAALGKGR